MDNRLTLNSIFGFAYLDKAASAVQVRLMFLQTPNLPKNGVDCPLGRQVKVGKPAIHPFRVVRVTHAFNDRL